MPVFITSQTDKAVTSVYKVYVKKKKKKKNKGKYLFHLFLLHSCQKDLCLMQVTPASEKVPAPGYLLHITWRGNFRRFPAERSITSGSPCRIYLQMNHWLHHDFWCVENANASRQTPFKFLDALRQVFHPNICSVPFLIVKYFDCTHLLNRALFHILGLLDYW